MVVEIVVYDVESKDGLCKSWYAINDHFPNYFMVRSYAPWTGDLPLGVIHFSEQSAKESVDQHVAWYEAVKDVVKG